ncbi:hypothetical protein [Chondrinema litorale]|uniref:hypothetical protein n=1 Tax=Chondrinema litorale TaxID=2994555 RepID=UPI002543E1E6|nr:hypothetical protein [Chondrinema litorale]UZR94479.1 hypothetical protein OQ292_01430 [Chondrinema litorale]
MRYTLILFVFAFIFSCNVKAQTDFVNAYVITNSYDTIQGQIFYTGDLTLTNSCKFKPQFGEEITEYQPGEIRGFYLDNYKYFTTRKISSDKSEKLLFLEVLIKGDINILKLNTPVKNRYFIESNRDGLTEIPYVENIIYDHNHSYLSSSKRHYGILTHYTTKVPSLSRIIRNIHEPTEKRLVNLVENYHRLLYPSQQHTTFKRKKAEVDAFVEVFTGLPVYNSEFKTSYKRPNYGAIFHISSSHINKKIYLKTGLVSYFLNKINTDTESSVYKVKIPLQVEYLPRKGMIKPRLAYGFNFYEPLPNITALNVGITSKLYRSVGLSLNTETEFKNQMLVLPKKLFSFNASIGLLFKIK